MRSIRFFLAVGALLLAGALSARAQDLQVKGSVSDQANGEPLAGVVVQVQGQPNRYATTAADGEYSISVPSNGALVFTLLGYKTQEVAVSGRAVVNVAMASDSELLDEVVFIGYGTMRKRDLTGSVASVRNEEIIKRPTSNVMEALQGQVAGLDITRTTGDASAGVNMVLRGNRSINGSNTPLFIIDGMEGSYSELNPADIASVEVLKDASSTAVYGSAGANGVIIITTKNPSKGKFSVNFDGYHGINKIVSFPAINTGQDFIDFRRLAMQNGGEYTSDANLFTTQIQKAIDAGQWVDWWKLLAQTGTTDNYNLSTSFSNDRLDAYMSIGYYELNGITLNDRLKRYSMRTKLDFKANKWLKYGINLYAMYGNTDRRNSRVWNRVLNMAPLGVPYDENGVVNPFPIEGTSDLSPIADLEPGQYANNIKTLSLTPQGYVEITPLKGLSFRSVLGAYLSNAKTGIYTGNRSYQGLEWAQVQAQARNVMSYNYKWQNILTYDTTIASDHNLTVTAVAEWTKNQTEQSQAIANGYDADIYSYYNLAAATSTPQISSGYTGTQMMSYVGRLNYSYKGKYIATISARADGASLLAEGHKWAVFPAGAVAWRVSDEPWMQDIPQISNLKLRASYGVTGNAGASAYATQNLVRNGVYGMQDVTTNYSGYQLSIANKNLEWEKSYTWDVGLELGLFNDRIALEFDWYNTHTTGLLYQQNLPYAQGGYGSSPFSMWANVGETLNRGIEITLNTRNIITRDFQWSSTLTFAANHEEVLKTTQDTPLQFGSYYLIPGQPIQTYYNYKYAGIWGTAEAAEAAKYGAIPGEVRLEDVPDENGQVDYLYNQNDYQVLGYNTPKWTAGFTNNFTWKNFDLSVHMIARWGWMMSYGITGWYRQSGTSPSPKICDYWTPENQSARWPAPNSVRSDTYAGAANRLDASYIKIKNLQLGYTLPQRWSDALGISRARVYFTASDPLIWTKVKYFKDYDPEKGGDDDDTPLSKEFVFGINITF